MLLRICICIYDSMLSAEFGERVVGTWPWGRDIKLEMLVDNAILVFANLRLLSLDEGRVVILIEVVQGRVHIRGWGRLFSGWNIESVFRFSERELALCFKL